MTAPAHVGSVRSEIVTEVTLLPAGCPPEHVEARLFAVRVKWRGVQNDKKSLGGYAVEHLTSHLTRAGTWIHLPQPFQIHLCRFDTLDAALEAARAVVDDVRVNGRTWADLQLLLNGRGHQ